LLVESTSVNVTKFCPTNNPENVLFCNVEFNIFSLSKTKSF